VPNELAAVILAHQGGWDEMLLVATPIALLAGVLWLANRRAGRMQAERADQGTVTDDADDAESATSD